jgi:hypothetical protein
VKHVSSYVNISPLPIAQVLLTYLHPTDRSSAFAEDLHIVTQNKNALQNKEENKRKTACL